MTTGHPTPDDSDDVVEVRSSPIEGLGVFALRDFAAGERIRRANIVREVTDADPLRPEDGELDKHCSHPDGRDVLWGHPDRHVNHSCDPNAFERPDGERIDIIARRSIAAGEEITFDYLINNSGGDSWPCNCGTERCSGMTGTSFFDLPAEFRHEYRPLLAEWFVARHADRFDPTV